MELFKNLGRAMGEAANFLAGEKPPGRSDQPHPCGYPPDREENPGGIHRPGTLLLSQPRDKENAVTEPHCAALDQAEKALDAALDKLTEYYSSEDVQEEVTLEDVTAYDQDPEAAPAEAVEPAPAQEAAPAQQETAPEEDNDNLPFEG